MDQLEAQLTLDPYEAVEMPFADSRMQTRQAAELRDTLRALADRPEGQMGIDAFLQPTRTNPYARYRDIGIVAIGSAVVAVPDDAWADSRLRSILLAGLDAEGVTFTFELPTLVLEEARRRKRAAPELETYVNRAWAYVNDPDRWGTGTRALSAGSASLAAQGEGEMAMAALIAASRLAPGFAGYASAAYIALANRCIEIGHAEAAADPIWGPNGNAGLVNLARDQAYRVLDNRFRDERVDLVNRFAGWLKEPAPDLKAVERFLAVTPDPDARRAFKDLAAAHWTAAGTAESRQWLKSLVPMVLEDTTTLDSMLGRVIRPALPTLTNRELSDVQDVVASGLSDGRPWDLAIGQP
jgi:hypothetical protein